MRPRGEARCGGLDLPARARQWSVSSDDIRQPPITALTKGVAAPPVRNMPAAVGWSAAPAVPVRPVVGASALRAGSATEAAPTVVPPAPDTATGVMAAQAAVPATVERAAPAISRPISGSPAPAARSTPVSTAWSAAHTCRVWPAALVSASTAADPAPDDGIGDPVSDGHEDGNRPPGYRLMLREMAADERPREKLKLPAGSSGR